MKKSEKPKKEKNIWDKNAKIEENGYYWKGEPKTFSAGNAKKQKGPLVVELFCGCGGTSKGFEMAKYTIVLGLDIHKSSIETFSKNNPNAIAILGDIKKTKPKMLLEKLGSRNIDVLIAGVPCQGFSLNNRKRNAKDKRNFLYREFIKYIKALKPKVVILENVLGMLSAANGKFVKKIEKDISREGEMVVTSKLLCAADYGVPQIRKRIVFVGIRDGPEFDFDSDLKKTHGPNTKKPYNTIKDAISDLPSLKADEESSLYNKPPETTYQKLMRGKVKTLHNHKAPNHPKQTIKNIERTEPGKPMYKKFQQRIRLSWSIQSPTQVSGGIRPQFQFGHQADARGLTVRERCRIQSFPDDFVIYGGIVQGRVQTGNAVPPLLAKALAKAIKKYLK